MEMELGCGTIMSWLLVPNEHHTVRVELELRSQSGHGLGFLFRAGVAFRR
jgi:hypothetical protein